jgi:integrase/recombinase XerD
VFRNCHGRRLGVRSVQRMVAAARTDVTYVTPHVFRHAHSTHSLKNGCLLPELQKQLGHSDISTTGIYLHVSADEGSGNYISL